MKKQSFALFFKHLNNCCAIFHLPDIPLWKGMFMNAYENIFKVLHWRHSFRFVFSLDECLGVYPFSAKELDIDPKLFEDSLVETVWISEISRVVRVETGFEIIGSLCLNWPTTTPR